MSDMTGTPWYVWLTGAVFAACLLCSLVSVVREIWWEIRPLPPGLVAEIGTEIGQDMRISSLADWR